MSTNKRIGTSVAALSAFTLMIASVGNANATPVVPHETVQQTTVTAGIRDVSSPLALDAILSPESLLQSQKGLTAQQDIHHHNWLGGDNDVQTDAAGASALASIAGNNTSRFDV